MKDDGKKLAFYMDAYSPETISMAKLAEYMADLAALFGKEHAVHFDHLESGSTVIVSRIEFEDVPKVTTRLNDIRNGTAPKELARLMMEIDNRLANDNATGRIVFKEGGAELLAFPGRDRPKMPIYGPFNQDGHLDGVLFSIVGRDQSVSLRLQNAETIYTGCETNRTTARELGKHMFEPVRVHGTGRWIRDEAGQWILRHFRVYRFEVLGTDSLRDTVTALRAVQGSGWKDIDDPLAQLDDLRREKDEIH